MAKIKGWKYIGYISLSPGLERQYMWSSDKGKVILVNNKGEYEVSTDSGDIYHSDFGSKTKAIVYARNFMRSHPNG